jgi:hypothetical protein
MTTKQTIENLISDFKENREEKSEGCYALIGVRVPLSSKKKYDDTQAETDQALSKLLSQVVVKTIDEVKS